MKARKFLKQRGWVQVPSHVKFPAGASEYWQRWENGSPHGWIELPAHMPVSMVLQTISQMPCGDRLVVSFPENAH